MKGCEARRPSGGRGCGSVVGHTHGERFRPEAEQRGEAGAREEAARLHLDSLSNEAIVQRQIAAAQQLHRAVDDVEALEHACA